jgi:hypothetical protein
LLLLIIIEPENSDADERVKLLEEIAAKIKDSSAIDHRRPLDSAWLVEAEEDVDWWTHYLFESEGYPARGLVVRVRGRINGLIPAEQWDWVNEHAGK